MCSLLIVEPSLPKLRITHWKSVRVQHNLFILLKESIPLNFLVLMGKAEVRWWLLLLPVNSAQRTGFLIRTCCGQQQQQPFSQHWSLSCVFYVPYRRNCHWFQKCTWFIIESYLDARRERERLYIVPFDRFTVNKTDTALFILYMMRVPCCSRR